MNPEVRAARDAWLVAEEARDNYRPKWYAARQAMWNTESAYDSFCAIDQDMEDYEARLLAAWKLYKDAVDRAYALKGLPLPIH